jgi:hypothetical protein
MYAINAMLREGLRYIVKRQQRHGTAVLEVSSTLARSVD